MDVYRLLCECKSRLTFELLWNHAGVVFKQIACNNKGRSVLGVSRGLDSSTTDSCLFWTWAKTRIPSQQMQGSLHALNSIKPISAHSAFKNMLETKRRSSQESHYTLSNITEELKFDIVQVKGRIVFRFCSGKMSAFSRAYVYSGILEAGVRPDPLPMETQTLCTG